MSDHMLLITGGTLQSHSMKTSEDGGRVECSSPVQHPEKSNRRQRRRSYIWRVLLAKKCQNELCHLGVGYDNFSLKDWIHSTSIGLGAIANLAKLANVILLATDCCCKTFLPCL